MKSTFENMRAAKIRIRSSMYATWSHAMITLKASRCWLWPNVDIILVWTLIVAFKFIYFSSSAKQAYSLYHYSRYTLLEDLTITRAVCENSPKYRTSRDSSPGAFIRFFRYCPYFRLSVFFRQGQNESFI